MAWDDGLVTLKPGETGAASKPPEATSFDPNAVRMQYIWNEIKKMPGSILGMPGIFDAMNSAAKKSGVPVQIPLGGPSAESIHKLMGVTPDMKPLDKLADYGGILATNLLASGPFAAARAGSAAPGILSRTLAAIPDVTAGIGGGVGGVFGKEAGGGIGEVIGNLAGTASGFRAGNVGAETAKVINEANALRKEIGAEGFTGYAERKAGPEINRQASNMTANEVKAAAGTMDRADMLNRLNEGEGIAAKFGVKPSVGEVTGNQALLDKQSLVTHATQGAMTEELTRQGANAKAVAEAKGGLLPVPGKSETAIMSTGRRRVEQQLSEIAAREAETGAAQADVAGAVQTKPLATVGQGLKDVQAESMGVDKGISGQKYQEFRTAVEDAGNPNVDVSDIGGKIRDLREKFKFDRTPDLFTEFEKASAPKAGEKPSFSWDKPAGAAETGPAQLDVLQLDDLTRAARRDLRVAQSRRDRDFVLEKQLQDLIGASKAKMGEALAEHPDAATAMATADKFFKDVYVPKYRTGSNLDMTLKTSAGEPRVTPESVTSLYFSSNKNEATTQAQRFKDLYGESKTANGLLQSGVNDLYRREVIEKGNGVVLAKNHDAFMRKYQDALSAYPNIGGQLAETGAKAAQLEAKAVGITAEAAALRDSKLAKIYGDKDPDALIKEAFSSKRSMFNTLAQMPKADRQAFAGNVLSRAWDETVAGKGGKVSSLLENEDQLKFMLRNAYGARMGEEQMRNLKELSTVLTYQSRQPQMSGELAKQASGMKEKLGFTGVSVWAALRATVAGRGSAPYFGAIFGGQALGKLSERQHMALLKEALYDPAKLRDWLAVAEQKPDVKSALTRMMDWGGPVLKAVLGKGVPQAVLERSPTFGMSSRGEQQEQQ